jgi:hypothetical protein
MMPVRLAGMSRSAARPMLRGDAAAAGVDLVEL